MNELQSWSSVIVGNKAWKIDVRNIGKGVEGIEEEITGDKSAEERATAVNEVNAHGIWDHDNYQDDVQGYAESSCINPGLLTAQSRQPYDEAVAAACFDSFAAAQRLADTDTPVTPTKNPRQVHEYTGQDSSYEMESPEAIVSRAPALVHRPWSITLYVKATRTSSWKKTVTTVESPKLPTPHAASRRVPYVDLIQEYLRSGDIESGLFDYPKKPGKFCYKIKCPTNGLGSKKHKFYSHDEIHKVLKNADQVLGHWWRERMGDRKDAARKVQEHFETNRNTLDINSDANRSLNSRLSAPGRKTIHHLLKKKDGKNY